MRGRLDCIVGAEEPSRGLDSAVILIRSSKKALSFAIPLSLGADEKNDLAGLVATGVRTCRVIREGTIAYGEPSSHSSSSHSLGCRGGLRADGLAGEGKCSGLFGSCNTDAAVDQKSCEPNAYDNIGQDAPFPNSPQDPAASWTESRTTTSAPVRRAISRTVSST